MKLDKTITSDKQIKANQANSKKSTGAKTISGKLAVSGNAVKHGLFAQRLILNDENLGEYAQLIDGLIDALNPVGTLEQLLVEKIAVATWKQLRLTRAESAGIELDRRLELQSNRNLISKAMGRTYCKPDIAIEEFAQHTEEDKEFYAWCNQINEEAGNLLSSVFLDKDVLKIKKNAPLVYAHFLEEAESDGYKLEEYIDFLNKEDNDGFYYGYLKLIQWTRDEIAIFNRKEMVQSIGLHVKDKFSAPISNELIVRYQAGVDNELYKAIEALRKQQEWRSKGIITLDSHSA